MTSTIFSNKGVSVSSAPSGVLTLLLDRNDNVVNPSMVHALDGALATVEAAEHPKALVVTGKGKFFSNGLDVNWMMANPAEAPSMVESFWRFLARLLVLDCRTVCAINGHAYGAGLFVALACDWRLMRTERGFVNFPELNLGMRLSKPFAELAKSKLSAAALREGVLTGKRYGSADAVAAGVIDGECAADALPTEAHALAHAGLPDQLKLMRFDPVAFATMKTELYTDAYCALSTGTSTAEPHARL